MLHLLTKQFQALQDISMNSLSRNWRPSLEIKASNINTAIKYFLKNLNVHRCVSNPLHWIKQTRTVTSQVSRFCVSYTRLKINIFILGHQTTKWMERTNERTNEWTNEQNNYDTLAQIYIGYWVSERYPACSCQQNKIVNLFDQMTVLRKLNKQWLLDLPISVYFLPESVWYFVFISVYFLPESVHHLVSYRADVFCAH